MARKDNIIPKILFEDANIIVLSKPVGLLSQGGNCHAANLVDWLKDYWHRQYVGLVHRLDRNTSGIMIVAKRSKAARRLSAALVEGKLKRVYRAWLSGELKKKAVWKNQIQKNHQKNIAKIVSRENPRGKEAILWVYPLAYGRYFTQKVTLAEFELETGRSHQIRLQAAHARHPLLGDMKYGLKGRSGTSRSFGRPALHSYSIDFPHPISSEIMHFVDPLPQDMRSIRIERRISHHLRSGA